MPASSFSVHTQGLLRDSTHVHTPGETQLTCGAPKASLSCQPGGTCRSQGSYKQQKS